MRIVRKLRDLYPPATIISIACGGALAACLRFAVGEFFSGSSAGATSAAVVFFGGATATLIVNIAGCFILGALSRLGSNTAVSVGAATGFCGSLTTFSSFSVDAARMLSASSKTAGGADLAAVGAISEPMRALLYICVTVIAGCVTFIFGRFVMTALRAERGQR